MGPHLAGFARMTPLLHGNDARERIDARDQTVDQESDAIEGVTTECCRSVGRSSRRARGRNF
jgi:hypothetical protein